MPRTPQRLRHLELNLDDRRAPARAASRTSARRSSFDVRQSSNTLPPSEEVLERRNHLKRVVVERAPGAQTRNNIRENFIFLLLLGASIYATYRLCIYILNL